MRTAKKSFQETVVTTLKLIQGGALAGEKTPDKYHTLFDQASDAIITVNSSGKIDDVNRAFEIMTGYVKTEIEAQSVSCLFPAQSRLPSRTRPLAHEHIVSNGTYEDICIRQKDGQVRIVELSVRQVNNRKSKMGIAIFRDVTERRKMERELVTKHGELQNAYVELEKTNMELKATQNTLVQSGKMAALGELTAGIAHELNQPLQAIRGYAQELQALANAPVGNQEMCLSEIVSNVDKMAKIISYMRNYSRKSTEGHEWVSLATVFHEASKMFLRQYTSRGIVMTYNVPSDLLQIWGNPIQIEQVVINLMSNARDAIDETRRGKGAVHVAMRAKEKFIEIDVTDDGVGMTETTKSKAFNPFFTTKEVGKGMGLGLSLSYGILNKIKGSITVESELGKGSTFTVRLPVDFRELG